MNDKNIIILSMVAIVAIIGIVGIFGIIKNNYEVPSETKNLAGQADGALKDCNYPPGEPPKIFSVIPTTAKVGDTITVQGVYLTTTVQFYSASARYTYGYNDGVKVDNTCAQTTITVPSDLPAGSYTLKIYKARDKISNGIAVTIIGSNQAQISTKIIPPSEGLYMGQNKLSPTDIATFENSTGRKVALWSPYNVMQGQEEADEGTLSFDVAAANKAWNDGYIVMVGAYEASPVHKGFNVDRLLKGNYDSDLKKLAAQFRAFGKPMFFSTAREPNGVLAAYMGGFGPDGNESFGWAIQNNKGLAEFNPSKFPNPQLYEGLGNSNVCDGLERLAAAQRYYYDFFVIREKINFLTFDTMGWAVPITESDEPKDSVIYKCSDFGQFYSGIKNYNDWVSINWYMYRAGTEPPLQDYANALNNLMTKIRLVAPNKPILITELGFCGANRTEKVNTGLSEIMKYPEIKGFALWGSSQEGGYEGGSFPDCLIGPNTPEGDAFKKIINTNQNFFQSCAYFSDGTKIPNCENSLPSSAQISQFRFNPENTGQNRFTGPQTNKTKWIFKESSSLGCAPRQTIMTTPVLDSIGNIYFGTSEGSLIALNSAGKQIWRFKLPDAYPRNNCADTGKGAIYDYNIGFMPALDNTGTIYFGTSGIGNAKKIYALNKKDGTKKWESSIDGPLQSHIKIGYNGKLYFTTLSTLYELNTNGNKIASYPAVGKMNVPAIGKDGTVYVCSDKGLVAFDANLNKKWIYNTNNPLKTCQSAVDPTTGVIYFPEKNRDTQEYKLDAINPDGTLKWSANIFWTESAAAIAQDGTIYVGTTDLSKNTTPTSYPIANGNGVLFALNPNGQEKWKFYVPPVLICKKGTDADCLDSDRWKNARAIDISPTIGKDGTIYFGSDVGLYIALSPDGKTVKWIYQDADEWDNTAMIAPDGTLYVGHGGGYYGGLYAFSDSGTISNNTSESCQVGTEKGVKCPSKAQCSSGEWVNGCCIGGTCST